MEEKVIGKYRIIRKIGEGGMGNVYLVEDIVLKKLYAMKEGLPELMLAESERMKTMSDRRFPYLVDIFQEEGKGFVVMEYIEGPTLEEYIRKHAPMSEQETLGIMKQLAGMLEYLHSCRPAVIYLDLKPSNLVLQSDGELRLIDFGSSLQGFGRLKPAYSYGTYGYCAPEQKKGLALTPASDIYACGVIMYYMVTGIDPSKPPYGVSAIKDVSLTVSSALGKIIDTCCNPVPEKRYADGKILLDSLNSVLTKREELKDTFTLIAYYVVLFAAAAYTGWGVSRLYAGGDNKVILGVSMLALCAASWLARRIILDRHIRKHFIKKREWNIIYTGKKTVGLWCLVMMIFLASGCIRQEAPDRLNVYVSDSAGNRILIRDGCEYRTEGDLNFCLPIEENGHYEVYFYKLNEHHIIQEEQVFLIR